MAPNTNKLRYVKLNRMAPATHGHNIIVKVLEKSTIVDKTLANGTHVREELVLVADNTGCMYLHARDGQCDKLVEGETVALNDAKVTLNKGRMQLGFDKWGSIHSTPIVIPGEVRRDPNFSDTTYNEVTEER